MSAEYKITISITKLGKVSQYTTLKWGIVAQISDEMN